MSSPAREQPLTRERALAELVHVVSVRPELGMRALMAAMKGRRAQVTAEQLTDLLASGRFRAAGSGWALAHGGIHPGEQMPIGEAGSGRAQAVGAAQAPDAAPPRLPGPAAISWDPVELADVLDATAEELSHAVWVLAQNEDTAPQWSENLKRLRRGGPLPLTSDDLKELRGQLKAMVREQPTPEPARGPQPGHDARPEVAAAPSTPLPLPSRMPVADRHRMGSPGASNVSVHAPRWEDGIGGCKVYRCAPAATFGEARLAEELAKMQHGLVILSPVLALRGDTREVDAVIIARGGVVAVEQKDVPQGAAVLKIGPNSAPEVDGQVVDGLSRAWRQARLHAQKLATLLKQETTPAIDPGFVNAVLSFEGVAKVDGKPSQVWPTTTRRVSETVVACLTQRPFTLSAPEVARILAALGTRELTVAELVEAGFAR